MTELTRLRRSAETSLVESRLSVDEAYRAMVAFLDEYCARTRADEVGGLVGSMGDLVAAVRDLLSADAGRVPRRLVEQLEAAGDDV